MRLEDVLKMSWRRFWRRLEDVLKTSWRRLGKTSWRCLEDVLKTFLQDVLKTFWRRIEDVLTKYDRDNYIGLDQDVFRTLWRGLLKTYEEGKYIRLDRYVFKTSSRRLLKTKTKDIFKMSSRRLHQDEWLLGYLIFSETVCHISHFLVYFCYLWAMTHFKEFEKFLTRLFLSVVFINLDCVYM